MRGREDFGNPSFPLYETLGLISEVELELHSLTGGNKTRWWVRVEIVMSLLQVPTVPGGRGVGEQPPGPIKLTWRQGQPAPEVMASQYGAAVGHGSTAYFSRYNTVYSCTVPENKWTKLPECKHESFAMAVFNDTLTTIGGMDHHGAAANTLLTLSGSSWEEILPPMPTKRVLPAAANTSTHLVVAGGSQSRFGQDPVATVEVLNTETLQWSTAISLPETVSFPQMTTCGGHIYLANSGNKVFSSYKEDLLKSTISSDGGSVWTRLANIPAPQMSTLATLRGRVLAIGGRDGGNPTGAIHCYDVATDSWSFMGEVPSPRYLALTAVLPSNELVVVGGVDTNVLYCTTTEISTC